MRLRIMFVILMALLFASCNSLQPKQTKVKCWEKVYSTAIDLAFVVTMVNNCNGRVEYNVIQPIKDYLDRVEKRVDKFRADEAKKQAAGKLY